MQADVIDEARPTLRNTPAEESRDLSLSPQPAPRPMLTRTVLASGIAAIIAVGGVLWITASPTTETTDDAYVAADTTNLAPRVRGLVADVMVRDNQAVHRGDPLVRIDPEEFDARLASAMADLDDARANVSAARAALVSLDAEQGLAAANIVATRTTIRSSVAEAARAAADQRRYDALVTSGAVAHREADLYRTTAIGAEQGAAKAQAELVVMEHQATVTSARRGTLDAALAKALAQERRAASILRLAQQDRRHSLIRAPVDGVVGNRQVQVGDYVQPGSRLLSLVPLHDLYVVANFKETQTREMRIGQVVSIDVDALSGDALRGRIDSFAPGSGSTFALLPFEPGTGNFTKIVQRMPVRIRLDPGQTALRALRPGLSVTAKVRLSR